MVEVAPPQDLHEVKPERKDPRWDAIRPFSLSASPSRLSKPSQTVMVRNTSEKQTIIVRDRYEQGQELRAGQSREMELLAEDISYFLRERQPGRRDTYGNIKPLHPILVEGISEDGVRKALEDWDRQEKERIALAVKQTARDQLTDILRDAGISVTAPRQESEEQSQQGRRK